ncbi:hypothetical protein [Falsiroseomonas sp. CW058]|uniref:hypothetical protein n=1 Tax=Falsiroseomonas sp. CW058 TaxID=3388664 RepID=UPI003D31396D
MIRDATGVTAALPVPAARQGAEAAQPATPPLPAAAPELAAQFNPALRLDPALNLVVIEFRGADGEVLRSIPSEREIAAYRSGERPEPKTLTPQLDVKG